MTVHESFSRKRVDTAPGRNLIFLFSLLNSWPSLCHPANEKHFITYLSKGIIWVLFFSACFTCFPGLIQAPAYFKNNPVRSSSTELSHFLSNVIHEGMIDYKHSVVVWRVGEGRARYGITVFPVPIAKPWYELTSFIVLFQAFRLLIAVLELCHLVVPFECVSLSQSC